MMKLLLLIFLLTLSASWAADPAYKDFHYGDHERQIFDLWLPENNSSAPLVVFIHGGGWVMGSKEDILGDRRIIDEYLKNGMAVASINYRYLKHAPLQTIMREDIAGFIQFMRFHAEKFHLNKSKIMTMGYSAGGSASLWLGTHDDIADPSSADPIKRESSRITAFAHLNAQFTYDFFEWYHFLGKELTDKFLGQQVWSRYHLNGLNDLSTPEGIAIRDDLNSLKNMDSDDAPMYLWNSYQEKDIQSADADYFMHGPHHARILEERAQAVGLSSVIKIHADGNLVSDHMLEVFKFFKRMSK